MAVAPTFAVSVLAVVAVWLQGCGGGGGNPPTPQPRPTPTPVPTPNSSKTPTPTVPQPTPTPTTPQPTSPSNWSQIFCTDAKCCKDTVKHKQDERLCDEFYKEEVGIAWSMISTDSWQHVGRGWSGMDTAAFNDEPPAKCNISIEQAMSLSNYKKGSFTFNGGKAAYGLAFSVGPESNFWQYFWVCHGGGLMADCHDGVNHCARNPDTGAWHTMAEYNYTFDRFQEEKNEIVKKTGVTQECGNRNFNTYNEFDVNGLSSQLAGIFVSNATNYLEVPGDAEVCKFLAVAKVHRQGGKWPLWMYRPVWGEQRSSLNVDRYIDCGPSSIVV